MKLDRNAVKRLILKEGPAAARYRFGDAIVSDILIRGTRTATTDCGDGPCSCGGHGHVHPAHSNDHEARLAARRAAYTDAARAGVTEARLKVEQATRLRAFLQSGRRAR
ncbi:hypothetical protein [Methylobacterium sp. GC_Met_2]|uniref:hypothetical protein n=1 Tax=Methylobacterium sp. GC_Met_2 TaxID=2937376 RepID=UPI00226BA91E|nr:hypothetical protein [Methylobacterium sp. GC_Met_2]